MKPGQVIGEYFRGWGNFAGSAIYVFLCQVLVFLPVIAARVFFGNQFHAGHPDNSLAWAALLLVLAAWVPVVSNKLGLLRFESDTEDTEAPRRTEPETQRLRRIVRAAEDGRPGRPEESQ